MVAVMVTLTTTELSNIQPICGVWPDKYVVDAWAMRIPSDPGDAGRWAKRQREDRGLSADTLARRVTGLAREAGDPTSLSQQNLSKFEQGNNKRMPAWARFLAAALDAFDEETAEDPHLSLAPTDRSVEIKRLPVFAGMGDGGLDDDQDFGVVSFSRDLVENELRAPPEMLLAMVAEGNSMEPDFRGGDQILVDTRRRSLAQPGAFCLWDGDGYVIKFLEKMPGSEPAKVKVISANSLYEARERLVEEINLVGRVVWFGRRVQ
jgi:phage repressor protein C with HTH and peptisase S24 domain